MDQNLRTNIKKTAAKLFLKYGLRSVSIDDICNELRISKKTFYTHFSQKEELIDSVLTEHNEKRLKKQDSKSNPCQFPGNAIDQLMMASAFFSSTKNDRFMNFFYDLNKYYPEIHKKISQHNQEHIREKIRGNILLGIDEGIYRLDFDIEQMARYMTLQFTTMSSLSFRDFGKASLRKSLALVLDVYFRTLCNRQGLDHYEKLLAENLNGKAREEEPLKDEELDRIIDEMIDNQEEIRQIVEN